MPFRNCVFHDFSKKISVGSSANINRYVLRKVHVKCGAFVRPVTIILKFSTKPPD